MRFLTWGAIGVAIFGVVRGMRNGTLKQFTQNMPNKLNLQNLQQMTKPLQQATQPLQGMANNPLTDKLPKQQGF
ncbi:hypothetical protein [Bacillus sp. Cr_A10]|uniref:hypothetical protein n=1 Tax=Bacillus sp. Cr_A10 TaxID=3033993 RepID=UPI0023DC272E|nr:hypothetical protein [Bacillus sp. Cr_A10]MDF2066831.1 hypothetical protein [Bacillus sp. Cr_A10]